MNSYIWVSIKNDNYYKLIYKLNNIDINILDSKILDNKLIIKINYSDYKRIKKYLISYKISIYSYSNIKNKINIIKHNYVYFIGSLLAIIILLFLNSIIVKIDIKTNNKEVKEVINEELIKYNIKPLSLKKKHKTIELIVNKIINNNEEIIEWLEIKYDGLIMIVNVIEKVNEDEIIKHDYCNLVAKKDGKILSMNVYDGTILKNINDYVKKDDVILSGDILLNDELKGNVCANGKVYGEVWYKVSLNIPLKEEYKEYTNKERINFNIKINDNKYKLLRSRLNKFTIEEENIYKLNDFEINLVHEKEYKLNERILTEEEAYNKGIRLANEKIKLTMNEDEEILFQKVLKKQANNSTMYLDIFIVAKMNIGKVVVLNYESNSFEDNN